MEAGRELDAMIAEKVMGIDPSDRPLRPGFHHGSATSAPLPYSTDIAAAWEVVGQMIGQHNSAFSMSGGGPEMKFCACFKGQTAWAETAPHAICLAALKAVG